jgi:Zn-dependent protease
VSGSLSLGRVAGIAIRVHWTFQVMLAAVALSVDAPLAVLGLLGLMVASVLVHELGHGLAARAYGVRVLDITFWPLGGMARMANMPERAGPEAAIAAAGPLVNLAIAGLSVAALVALSLADAARTPRLLEVLVEAVLWINASMGLFNLVPAFPLDGGRILRAILALRLDWLRATEVAARVGRWVVLLGLVAVVAFARGMLCPAIALALYLWFEGTRELWMARLRHAGAWPGRAPAPGGATAPSGGATSGAWFGILRHGKRAPEAQAAPGQARRPSSWSLDRLAHGGISDEDLAALERFRGRLRPPPVPPVD